MGMARLIDAKALEKQIKEAFEDINPVLMGLMLRWVRKQTKVDAVEVVHGHMVERIVDHECPWYTVYDCSECGCTVERWHSYCPNCGAKMDGERKDND